MLLIRVCMPPLSQQGTFLQFFVGGDRSGAAVHFHANAYNVLFFGTKEWLLTPPRYAHISGPRPSQL